MQSKGLLEVIENLMEGEMTAKDPIKNPQEETDEMEEAAQEASNKEGNDGKGSNGVPADAGKGDPNKNEINKAPVCNEEEECDEEDEPVEEETGEKLESPPSKDEVGDKQADCCDPEGNAEGGEKVAGDPNKTEINKAPVVNEEEESDDEEEVAESEDPNHTKINKAPELKSGSGKVAGKDGKMNVEAADCDEEEEVAESEDPNHTKINKAPELKSGSGKVAGKDGKMNVEAADCDDVEEADLDDDEIDALKKVAAKHEEAECDEEETVAEEVTIHVTEAKLKAGKGKVKLDVDYMGNKADALTASKKFNIKISVARDGAIVTGDKKNVLAYLQSDHYGMDDQDIEDLFPELMEAIVAEEKPEFLKKAIGKAIEKKKEAEEAEQNEAADCDEDEHEEELSAKQKKLDIDGDGEIGADDLKKVRAGQTAEESYDEEDDLEESFKTKAAIIFETAVNEKVNTKIEAIQEEYNKKLNEEINTINEKVGEYIDYAVQEWLRENKLEIKYSLRTEISENFIKGLKTLFEENYIDIPEEDISVVDELTETVESYKEQLEEQTSELDEARKEILEFHRQATLDEITEGLTQTQALKLEKLSESVEAVDIAEFKFKVEALKESYFDENGEAPLLSEEVLDGMGLVEEEEIQAPASTVDMYAQFLGKTIQK